MTVGTTSFVGFVQRARRSMVEFPTPSRSAGQVRRENLNIRVDHNMAWVTFEQVAPSTGDPFDVPGRQLRGELHRGLREHVEQFQAEAGSERLRQPPRDLRSALVAEVSGALKVVLD